MNQYKKLPACLSFLPTCLTIILCFLFTGTSAEPTDISIPVSIIDTASSGLSNTGKVYRENEVDTKAAYKEGVGAWRKYLERNINTNTLPEGAEAGCYKASVEMVITKQGTLRSFRSLTNNGHKMEDRLIDVLKKSAAWIPASVNGKDVDSYSTVSFNYEIAEQ